MAEPAGVDVHAHFFPESFIRIIEESGGAFGASVDRSNPKGPVLLVGGARTAPLDARYWDLDLRLRAMNRQGVATQALSLTAPMVYWADGATGARLAGAWNDAASAAHVAHPDRFVGCAMLPLQAPPRALAELERAARLPGIHGVYMGTNVGGRELSDPEFSPSSSARPRCGCPCCSIPCGWWAASGWLHTTSPTSSAIRSTPPSLPRTWSSEACSIVSPNSRCAYRMREAPCPTYTDGSGMDRA